MGAIVSCKKAAAAAVIVAVVVTRAAAGLSTVSGGARPRRPRSSTHAAGRRRSLARAARRQGVRTRGGGGGGDRRTDGCGGGMASRIAFPSFPHTGKERKGRDSTRGGFHQALELLLSSPSSCLARRFRAPGLTGRRGLGDRSSRSVGVVGFPSRPNEQQHEVEFLFIGERICSGSSYHSTRRRLLVTTPLRGARRPRQRQGAAGRRGRAASAEAGVQAESRSRRRRAPGAAPRAPRAGRTARTAGGGRAPRGSSRPGEEEELQRAPHRTASGRPHCAAGPP